MTAQRPTEESCLLYFCEKKRKSRNRNGQQNRKNDLKVGQKTQCPPHVGLPVRYLHRLLWLPDDARKSSHRHSEKINRTKVESYILPLIS